MNWAADKSLVRPGRKQVRKHVRGVCDFNKETRAVIKFLFLQGKAPNEIRAILTEKLACFLPGRAKNLSAPLYMSRAFFKAYFVYLSRKRRDYRHNLRSPSCKAPCYFRTILSKLQNLHQIVAEVLIIKFKENSPSELQVAACARTDRLFTHFTAQSLFAIFLHACV